MTTSIVPYPSLLPHLRAFIGSNEFAELWIDDDAWVGLALDYAPQRVERLTARLVARHGRPALWVHLHRTHPSEHSEKLWHSPPAFAMRLLEGECDVRAGFVHRTGLRTTMTCRLGAGQDVEVNDPIAQVYCRPIAVPAYDVTICKVGAAVVGEVPSARPLSASEVEDMRLAFGDLLVW